MEGTQGKGKQGKWEGRGREGGKARKKGERQREGGKGEGENMGNIIGKKNIKKRVKQAIGVAPKSLIRWNDGCNSVDYYIESPIDIMGVWFIEYLVMTFIYKLY